MWESQVGEGVLPEADLGLSIASHGAEGAQAECLTTSTV
jgi:hypothetical protein